MPHPSCPRQRLSCPLPPPSQAISIASQLLAVLEYLGSLRPAVVHRDIKPENIVLEGGSWGGRPFLVDFGGVQVRQAARGWVLAQGGTRQCAARSPPCNP